MPKVVRENPRHQIEFALHSEPILSSVISNYWEDNLLGRSPNLQSKGIKWTCFLIIPKSAFSFCWKFVHIQPVPKKGDLSNPSNYRPIALTSCLSKAFESILNKKTLKYLSDRNLLSDHQYGFRKGRSTGDLLAFLTESSSSPLTHFGESIAVALAISKAFDRVWHKSLISKLPSYGFYPISVPLSFLSDCSIATVVSGRCSSSKPINSGVPQGLSYHLLYLSYSLMIST